MHVQKSIIFIVLLFLPLFVKSEHPDNNLSIAVQFPHIQVASWSFTNQDLPNYEGNSDQDIPYSPTFRFTGGDIPGIRGSVSYDNYWLRLGVSSSLFSEMFNLQHTATLNDPKGDPIHVWDHRGRPPERTERTFEITADRTLIDTKAGIQVSERNSIYIYYTELNFDIGNMRYPGIVPGTETTPGWDINLFRTTYNSFGTGYLFHSNKRNWGYSLGLSLSPLSNWNVQLKNQQKIHTYQSYEFRFTAELHWKNFLFNYDYFFKNAYSNNTITSNGHSLSLSFNLRLF
jgi:hypothetical protein